MKAFSWMWIIGATVLLILLTVVYTRWLTLTNGYDRMKIKKSELTVLGEFEKNTIVVYRDIAVTDPTVLEYKLKLAVKSKFPNHKLLIFNIPKTPGYNAIHSVRNNSDWMKRTLDDLKRSSLNWLLLPFNLAVRSLYYVTQSLRELTMKDKMMVGGILVDKKKVIKRDRRQRLTSELSNILMEDYDLLYHKRSGVGINSVDKLVVGKKELEETVKIQNPYFVWNGKS